MFNEKNVKETLEMLFAVLDSEAEGSDKFSSNAGKSFLKHNLDEVYQALMANVKTVYQYDCHRPCYHYRAKDLFEQRACLIMDQLMEFEDGWMQTERLEELWLLEDMSLAVVENLSLTIPEGAANIKTTNRHVKQISSDYMEIEIDPSEFYDQLEECCQEWERNGRTIHSL